MAHDHRHQDDQNIGIAFILNLIFTVIEIIGGIYTNSLAILSDAIHDLGDSISLGLAWYFHKLSHKEANSKYTYGYRRFSILGAIINSVILIIGSFFIIKEAIPRLMNPQHAEAKGMLLLAVLGIIFNGAAYMKASHGHSHNEKVVSLHLLEDVLGWVAVLIGSIIIYFTDWFIIDPLLSIGISLFILYNVYKGIKSSVDIILQAVPENMEEAQMKKLILGIYGIKDVHDFHIWTMDGSHNIMSTHVVHDNTIDIIKLKKEIKKVMQDAGIHHCTLEFESVDEHCEPPPH